PPSWRESMSCSFRPPALGAGALIALGLALLPAGAHAALDQWTLLGLGTGVDATAVTADVASAGPVSVATPRGGLFKGGDAGVHWTAIDLHTYDRPRDNAPVLSTVAIDPNDHDFIVVGADAGRIYRTADGGATWARDRIGGDTQIVNALELGLGAFDAAGS